MYSEVLGSAGESSDKEVRIICDEGPVGEIGQVDRSVSLHSRHYQPREEEEAEHPSVNDVDCLIIPLVWQPL